jgi:hypothetical protein
MTWVRLDDGFYTHPKARAAGLQGRALYIAALCWSNQNLTDGHIPTDSLALICAYAEVKPTVAKKLAELGLWDVTDGGWQIHDFHEYQPTRESVERDRRQAKERMQAMRIRKRSAGVTPALRRNKAERSPEVRSTPSRPLSSTESSSYTESSSDPSYPQDDDDFLKAVATSYAQRCATANGKTNPAGYQRTIIANFTHDHAETVHDLRARAPNAPAHAIAEALHAGNSRPLAAWTDTT